MASIVLGVAGAAVGSMFGPIGTSIGWALGASLGGMLDPNKVEGPRLSDLKLQNSQYGMMIPLVYGTARLAGQVIWQTDLVEHEQTEGGKGGGPEVTTYSYSASFAILLCQGPIEGVVKIWADGRLVYDGSNAEEFPFTLYLGDESQLPDPTMEAELGAGNVNANRGHAYMVFDDIDLTPYGNRIPQLSVLVTTALANQFRRLTDWEVEPWLPNGFTPDDPAVSYDGGEVVIFKMAFANPPGGIHPEYWGQDSRLSTTFSRYSEFGNLISVTQSTYDGQYKAGLTRAYRCRNNPGWWYSNSNGQVRHPPSARYLWGDLWYGSGPVKVDQGWGCCVTDWVSSWDGTTAYMLGDANWDADDAPAGGGATLRSYPLSAAFNDNAPLRAYTIPGSTEGDQYEVQIDTDGTLWLIGYESLSHIQETSDGFELIFEWVWADIYTETGQHYEDFGRGAMFCGGRVATKGDRTGTIGSFTVEVYSLTVAAPYITSLGYITYAESDSVVATANVGKVYSVGSGVGWVQDGLIGICQDDGEGVPLSEIVADLSDRSGLAASEYDVSELTDMVDGFKVASQMTTRSAIEPLMTAYYFDGVETDGLVRFVKRGKHPSTVIDADDLGAMDERGEAVPPIVRRRAQEVDLPRSVNVVYDDINLDYQVGDQPSQRMTGNAVNEVSIAVPIVLDADKAKQIADIQLFNAWLERDTASISLPRKYADLDPTDVIEVDSESFVIRNRDATPYGPLVLALKRSSTQMWVPAAVGAGSEAGAESEITRKQKTALALFDIPYIDDAQRQAVYWAGMAGIDRREWPGAGLYKSNDDGTTYNLLLSSNEPDSMGKATTVLPWFGGGNVFDEASSVTVEMGPGAADLSSVTRARVLLGDNEAVLGAEIIQFRTATLTGTRTYTLTGLLRGRRGTEWAMATHAVGERFALLPLSTRINDVRAEYGMTTQWKAVTLGGTLAGATQFPFRSSGVPLLPYSPVHCGTGQNDNGDWLLQWTRRTRIDGAWLSWVDVPLGETTEAYEVSFYSDQACSQFLSKVTGITTESYTLTAAAALALYETAPDAVYWTVAQVGSIGPGYDSLGRAPLLADVEPYDPPEQEIDENVPPIGTQWHAEYVFTASPTLTNAEKNFNYFMANYGSSWAWCYLYITTSGARNRMISELADGTAIMNAMGGQGNLAPAGFLIPFGPQFVGGSYVYFGQPAAPLSLQAYVGGIAPANRVTIVLPYADNDLT